MQSWQHLCGDKKPLLRGQWIRDLKQNKTNKKTTGEWICSMGLGVTCSFFFLLSLFPFSMWFELLACRLLWVINTNECALFIFEILFWDVQAPCNRCLFIFIINNKSKDSLLFNLVKHSVWIVPVFKFLQPVKTFMEFYVGMTNSSAPKGREGEGIIRMMTAKFPKKLDFFLQMLRHLMSN